MLVETHHPPPQCDSLKVIEYERYGERVIELTTSPGNVGKPYEELEAVGHLKAGRIFSFKEERKQG